MTVFSALPLLDDDVYVKCRRALFTHREYLGRYGSRSDKASLLAVVLLLLCVGEA
jgi:hypothetical protein